MNAAAIKDWFFPPTAEKILHDKELVLEQEAVNRIASKWLVRPSELPVDPIDREVMLRKLQTINDKQQEDGYLVVVGKCASGKSTLIRQAFNGKEGVVYMHIPGLGRAEDIWPRAFFDAVGIPRALVKGTN